VGPLPDLEHSWTHLHHRRHAGHADPVEDGILRAVAESDQQGLEPVEARELTGLCGPRDDLGDQTQIGKGVEDGRCIGHASIVGGVDDGLPSPTDGVHSSR